MALYRCSESDNSVEFRIYIFKQMQRLFWIDLPDKVYCPLSNLIKCGLAIIRFMTLYGCTCPFALNVVFLHDPGPFLSRCIISVKYCSLGIPKASFYKGNVSSCVLVEIIQKVDSCC